MNLRRVRSGVCGWAFAAFTLASCGRVTSAPNEPNPAAARPGVVLFSLPDPDGTPVEVTTVAGGRTVLAFWATWCPPCQVELRELDGLYADYRRRGLAVYAVNVDDSSTAASVGAWVEQEGYRFPVVLDLDRQVLARYQPRMQIPFSVVLDGDGQVVEVLDGYDPEQLEALRARLDQALPDG